MGTWVERAEPKPLPSLAKIEREYGLDFGLSNPKSLCFGYLGLGKAEGGGEFGPLGEGEVLGPLEALVECLELEGGVDGPGLADLLPLPVDPHLAPLDDLRRMAFYNPPYLAPLSRPPYLAPYGLGFWLSRTL